MVSELIHVDSPNVSYGGDKITVDYEYATTSVRKIENRIVVSVKRIFFIIITIIAQYHHRDSLSMLAAFHACVHPFVTCVSIYRFFFRSVLIGFVFVKVTPEKVSLKIATDCHVPKLGLMLVGWGGNNGSTITAAFEANRNKLEWRTKDGIQQANWFGSITQASTILLGCAANGQDVYTPMNRLVPMVNPDDIGVWDLF